MRRRRVGVEPKTARQNPSRNQPRGGKNANRSARKKQKENILEATEDRFTKTVEQYTGAVPSSAYLGVAVAAAASLAFQAADLDKWGISLRYGSRPG
jgi:hypothetical protein